MVLIPKKQVQVFFCVQSVPVLCTFGLCTYIAYIIITLLFKLESKTCQYKVIS